MNGVIRVKKDQQGFGFITPADGGDDIFFHFSACVDKVDGFIALSEGMEVSFEVQDGQKGPMAVDVQGI
jgi:CspA family cold shock protein